MFIKCHNQVFQLDQDAQHVTGLQVTRRRLDLGRILARSVLHGQQGGIVDTMSQTSNISSIYLEPTLSVTSTSQSHGHRGCSKRKVPSTVEFPHTSNVTTYSARLVPCKKRTRVTKSTKTSAQASNTNVKVSRGFWSTSKMDISKKLWLPIKIDWRGSGSSSSNGSSLERGHISSFSTIRYYHPIRNSPATLWPSSTFSVAGSMEEEDTNGLSRTERLQRAKMYKGKSTEEKKALKEKFDSEKGPATMTRCRLAKLDLTPLQYSWMIKWFKDCRKTYNLALHQALKTGWHLQDQLLNGNLSSLESELNRLFVPKTSLVGTKYEYILRTPKVFRQQSIKELVSHFKTFKTNLKKRQYLQQKYPSNRRFQGKLKFHIKPKPRHINMDSISFDIANASPTKRSQFTTTSEYELWKSWSFRLFPTQNVNAHNHTKSSTLSPMKKVMLKKSTNTETGPINDQFFDHGKKIHYRFGSFYVIYPRHETVTTLPRRIGEIRPNSVCAIDPGVRKPFTIYSPDGKAEIIGTNCTKVLDKHIRRIYRTKQRLRLFEDSYGVRLQLVQSRLHKCRLRSSLRRLKKKYYDSEDKLRNVIKHFHYNVAHHLLSRYQTVIFPNFNGHSCMGGKLNPYVKKRMQALSFGLFKRRLVQVSSGYNGSKIITGSEAYTSKQCGVCGIINDKLGGSEVFTCRSSDCNIECDRDLHAARNILLRFLTNV